MDIRRGIASLERDIDSCRNMIPDSGKKSGLRKLCDCSKSGQPNAKTLCKTSREPPKGKSYHEGCVPKRAQKKSPVRRKSPVKNRFEKREQFETCSSKIDVEIKSTQPLSTAEVRCRSTSAERPKRLRDVCPTRQPGERDCGHQVPRPGSPKSKVSWGNILREQNCSVPHTPSSSEYRQKNPSCNRPRPSSCDENWCRAVAGFENDYREGRSYPEPATRERVCVRDSGVQCSSPPPSSRSDRSVFRSCDPLRTLQFLMDEFRTKAKTKCEPEVQNLVSDMENALQRLSQGSGFISANTNRPTKCPSAFTSEESATSKYQSDKQGSNSKHRSSANMRMLEESYQALVKTCQEAEIRCTKLVEEREKQLRELAEKNLLLEQCSRREREYECKLAEALRQNQVAEAKNMQFTKSVADLTEMLARLQEDNKIVGCLREEQGKLKAKMQELSQENFRLNTENQLMTLEKEKNKVLLQIKDQEIVKLKSDIQTIGCMVNDELRNRFNSIRLSSSSTIGLNSIDIGSSLSITSSTINNCDDENVICSSPNSSGCTTPSPSKSWARLSKIPSEPVIPQLGKSADVILTEKKKRAQRLEQRKKQQGQRYRQNMAQAIREEEEDRRKAKDQEPRLQCIEALKHQLQGFFEEMRHPLRLGTQCLESEQVDPVRTNPEQEQRMRDENESFTSLASTTSSAEGGSDPWAGSHTDSEASFAKFKANQCYIEGDDDFSWASLERLVSEDSFLPFSDFRDDCICPEDDEYDPNLAILEEECSFISLSNFRG